MHTNLKIGEKYPLGEIIHESFKIWENAHKYKNLGGNTRWHLGNIVRNQTQNFKIVEELTHFNVDLLRNTDNMEGSWRKT